MATLLLLKDWNMYSNRMIKRITSLDIRDFLLAHENLTYSMKSNVNFMINDGDATTHIIDLSFIPDYLIVADESGFIKSTWFVVEAIQLSGNQYRISLKRDLINDFYEQTINAPCFIEKATIPSNNPLIFNSEGMVFNQIKKEEWLLKDKSKVAWIVGYVSRPNEQSSDIKVQTTTNIDYDYTLESWELNDYIGRAIINTPNEWEFQMPFRKAFFGPDYFRNVKATSNLGEIQLSGTSSSIPGIPTVSSSYLLDTSYQVDNQKYNEIYETSFINYSSQLYEALLNNGYFSDSLTLLSQEKLAEAEGKILYSTQQDKYFRVTLNKGSSVSGYFKPSATSAIGTVLKAINTEIASLINSEGGKASLTESNTTYGYIYISGIIQSIVLEEIPSAQISTVIRTGRRPLNDAPYDMFAIPYGEIQIGNDTTASKSVALKIAQKIAEELGSNLFDMQLLPYCPIPQAIIDSKINLKTLVENVDYELITSTNDSTTTTYSIILWCSYSNGKIIIPFKHFVRNTKIENECDKWRINSPNYQGIFEFSAAKNNGIEFFQVDYTYRPYNPYIHVAPNWGGIYGQNYDDARGLICGGDFSVSIISDAFRQYEINNKNYQNVFDRQIKNLDVQRRFQLIGETANAITGTAQGAMLGGMAGGVAGAVVGGIASAVGGAADIGISQALYKENKSYQTDLYNYNLQNVQALPDSLTKNSSITYNNKVFPFVELYTCTDEEREALELKLKYNGMTIMKIGTINQYLIPGEEMFIQGQMIRILNLGEDDHVAKGIYEEIKKGVFL